MIRRVLTWALGTMLALPLPAAASLGGNLNSVEADRAFLRGTLERTAATGYSVRQIRMPNGVVVREYVSLAGNVFAVSWQGPTRPDLRELLGPYFETYIQSIPPKMKFRLVRGPVRIEANGLVVEMAGHARWLIGRAYLTTMLPAGVSAREIQ